MDELNPDRNFIMRGKTANVDAKPGHLTNSQLTKTTLGLSQNTLHGPDNDRRQSSEYTKYLLSSKSPSSLTTESSVSDIYDGSKYRDDLSSGDSHPSVLGRDNFYRDWDQLSFGSSQITKPENSEWYLNPTHLAQSKEYPILSSYGLPERSFRNRRPVGNMGVNLAAEKQIEDYLRDRRYPNPSTFSTQGRFEAFDPEQSMQREFRYGHRTPAMPLSTQDIKHQALDDYFDLKMNRLDDSRNPVIVTSPYDGELSKLRIERLRLEEDRLLEMKRSQELERIRGPKPKWYEFKTPDFTYECHKNNEMLRSRKDWKELFTYRNELLSATQEFSKLATV